MKIAIYDHLGLCYDGTTTEKRGLGGSESACIYISRELAKIGFEVFVYNDCSSDDAKPGVYDDVKYVPRELFEHSQPVDIFISMRSISPFHQFKDKIKDSYKVLWMHDTFTDGDTQLESMCLNGLIDKIFTLSDWHTLYASTADHGNRRMPEVMKRFIFQTRNGIVRRLPFVDIKKKDYNHYVYNASYTKGMDPLVRDIWPHVKRWIPEAHLTVIGGFYRFRSDHGPDQQEKDWEQLKKDYSDKDITFTGVITQQEVAEILANASWMIYPADFPETFGISTLEALNYNVPLLTCNFGALEETAIDSACYKIPYSVTPNGLFPNINKADQVEKFVAMTVLAHRNPYLHQQKQHACNIVHDISTWDTVALQWKQHFYKALDKYLPVKEYRKVSEISERVREVFGRRTTNSEDYRPYYSKNEKKIVIIIPCYNAGKYLQRCLDSIKAQDYSNYEIIAIDDASTDDTREILKKNNIFTLFNKERTGSAVANQVKVLSMNHSWYDIIMLIDADDYLANDPNIFNKYNMWHDDYDFTYGSCWSLADNIPLQAQEYPPEVKENKSYREYKFNWNMPYTHLRTFKYYLFTHVDQNNLKDENGNFYGPGGDGALFYELIEYCDPEQIKAVSDIVYMYNDLNPNNDYKINAEEQTKNANEILSKKKRHKFTVVVPTMWKGGDILHDALVKHAASDLVEEVIIVNNDVDSTPSWDILEHSKIRVLCQKYNIGVNPAWNLGVSEARTKLVNIVNDDFTYDLKLLERLQDHYDSMAAGDVYGIIAGEEAFGQPKYTSTDITIEKIIIDERGPHQKKMHGFGQCFFVHKEKWIPIIPELNIYFGDDFINHYTLARQRDIYMIYNISTVYKMASTTGTLENADEIITRENFYFNKWLMEQKMSYPSSLESEFLKAKEDKTSDIHAHLDTLKEYADKVRHITELGIRTGQSTRAFLNSKARFYRGYDLYLDPAAASVVDIARRDQTRDIKYLTGDSRKIDIEPTELLFIDTDHNYTQLYEELNRHHSKVSKYIIFHDTQTYGTINNHDTNPDEVGLLPAIIKFMVAHPEWIFDYISTDNNGLIVITKDSIHSRKKFSVIIPTMWCALDYTRYSLELLVNNQLVGEILLFDNAPDLRPDWDILQDSKINLITHPEGNIGVNPAWNKGARLAKYSKLCFANDDLYWDPNIFYKLEHLIIPDNGIYGATTVDAGGDVMFELWSWPKSFVNFGELFFIHQSNWVDIPDELVNGYGDYFQVWSQMDRELPVWLIRNLKQTRWVEGDTGEGATNSVMPKEFHEKQEARELPFYKNWAIPVGERWEKHLAKQTELARLMRQLPPEEVYKPIAPLSASIPKKKILIAIPTAKYIEPETLKSIYDLEVPDGYETEFQFFYGYRIDQVRNLIADWVVKGYDYLFAVDSDISFEPDTLKKLLEHNADIVSGVYKQRFDQDILEVYADGRRLTKEWLPHISCPYEIESCGFGCILIKKQVFITIGYPQFEYHVALDHANTVSEDTDFCIKARKHGFKVLLDNRVICGHKGEKWYNIK